MTNDQRGIRREKRVIEYPENIGNARKAGRCYGVARSNGGIDLQLAGAASLKRSHWTLRSMEVLNEADAVVQREFELSKGAGDACSSFAWEIVTTDGLNGTPLGSRWQDVTEFPQLDTTEVWRFTNRSGMTHPMHMHLVMFQVLDRQNFEEQGGLVVPEPALLLMLGSGVGVLFVLARMRRVKTRPEPGDGPLRVSHGCEMELRRPGGRVQS